MSVESTIVSAVEHTAEGAASSVVGTVVTAANPVTAIFGWLKIAGYVAAAALAAFLIWKVVNYVHTAEADHAAVATLTGQLSELKTVNANNEAAFAAKLAENELIVARGNRLAADLAALQSKVAAKQEGLRHAPSTSSYKPTADDRSFLDSVRQPTR